MSINKKKFQIEACTSPIANGYKATPTPPEEIINNPNKGFYDNLSSTYNTEEEKRKNLTEWSEKNYPMEHPTEKDTIKEYRENPFDRGECYCYAGDINVWFDKGVKYKCTNSSKTSVTFIDKHKDITTVDINKALKSFIWDMDKYTVEKPKEDRVEHPKHYTWLKDLCGIEPIDICRHLNFNEGNILKYLLRRGKEDIISLQEKRIEDLQKIIFYAKDEVKRLQK